MTKANKLKLKTNRASRMRVSDKYAVTKRELDDIEGFVRTVVRLSEGDTCHNGELKSYGLPVRLVIDAYLVAVQLDRIMKYPMDLAREQLARELGHCDEE